jgi:hypothetical protein
MDDDIAITLNTVDLLSDGGFVWTFTFWNKTSQGKLYAGKNTYVTDELGNSYWRIGKQDDKWLRAETQEKITITLGVKSHEFTSPPSP